MNAKQNKKVRFEELGIKEYQPAWDYQEQLMKEILDIKIKNRDFSSETSSL